MRLNLRLNLKKPNLTFIFALALVALGTACSEIPQEYTGTYSDAGGSGVTLELGTSDWTVTLPAAEPRVLKNSVSDLKYSKLLEGKAGIYTKKSNTNSNIVEVYWLMPKIATKKAAGNILSSMQAEIFMTYIDKSRESVNSLKMVHCVNGQIMMDLRKSCVEGSDTQDKDGFYDAGRKDQCWQAGCGADQKDYLMVRQSKEGA